MAAASPASSPRLPSPPPIAEDQTGPTSPGVSLFEEHGKPLGANTVDNGASRRIRPGTKAEDMAEGPPLIELAEIDSAFQLTEHLKALHYHHTHPPDSATLQPVTADIAKQLSTPPPNTSKDIWLYELGRFLIQKTNSIIVALFADSPSCSAQTCPEMRASEWQYLCAVHDPPKSCSAIDYCCHTLDWAAMTLTSSKMFPSRLGLGSGSGTSMGNDKVLQQQMKEIKNIFRRVYRIYAHAWFQHRDMFWRVEGRTGLYVFFKMVCDEYGIIEAENYTIPAEAEGLEPEPEQTTDDVQTPSVLKRDQDAGLGMLGGAAEKTSEEQPAGNTVLAMGDTTKRHRHTVSDLSSSENTVIEEAEEEDEAPQQEALLDRQSNAHPDPVEPSSETQEVDEAEETEQAEQEVDDEPVPGIARSDTMKPTKSGDEVAEPEEEDQTIIETPEENPSTEQSGPEDPKADSTEPHEQAAAEADDAGKSVGD